MPRIATVVLVLALTSIDAIHGTNLPGAPPLMIRACGSKNYWIERQLSATRWIARDSVTGRQVSIFVQDMYFDDVKAFEQGIELMKPLAHEHPNNFVQLECPPDLDFLQTRATFVTELCDHDLAHSLQGRQEPWTEVQVRESIATPLVSGLEQMARHNIYTVGGIQPSNLFWCNNKLKYGPPVFKHALKAKQSDYITGVDWNQGRNNWDRNYIAPEGYYRHQYGPRSDVYVIGKIIHELLAGAELSENMKELLQRALESNPMRRISLDNFFNLLSPAFHPEAAQTQAVGNLLEFGETNSNSPDVQMEENGVRLDYRYSSDDRYVVEKIMARHGNGKKKKYLIKWWRSIDETWEPLKHLETIEPYLKDFDEQNRDHHKGGKWKQVVVYNGDPL